MATNKSFPQTQVLIQTMQRQVQTLIERKDSYMMQVSQDWKTFRWSRTTLLSNPAAKLIRMKVHVFSDSTLCVGISNPGPSNNCATILDEVWNEHRFHETLNLAAREEHFMWHVLSGASTLDIKKHIQKYLNGQNPDIFC